MRGSFFLSEISERGNDSMKKLFTLLLVVLMLLAMACAMTACGGETGGTSSTADADNNADADKNESPFPAALTNVPASPVGQVDYTGWAFAGGMVNNVEMEQADADAYLAQQGGTLQFIFMGENKVQLVTGNGPTEGTYSVVADGYFIDATIGSDSYYGVFTEVEGAPVLILVNKKDSNTALYMRQISET